MYKRQGFVFHYHAGGLGEYLDNKKVLGAVGRWAYGKPLLSINIAKADSPTVHELYQTGDHAVIPNGIEDFAGSASLTERKSGKFRVLFLAGIEEAKGVLTVLDCARILKKKGLGESFEFRIAGAWRSKELKQRALGFCREHQLEGVTFVGLVTGEKKEAEFVSADLFFFPSFYHSENFPLVLLEAMAAGLPILASDWRGIPEIVEEGKTGYLFPPSDTKGFVDCLEELSKMDRSELQKLGSAARFRYEQEFTSERFCSRVEAEISNALSKSL